MHHPYKTLHQQNPSGQAQPKRAIVIGGSIAGLLSAKVLSDFFDEVTIIERDNIERDDIEGRSAARQGVPQSPQPHILLTRGYRILADLFPGLADDLTAAGAVPIDWGTDFHYFAFGGWNARQTTSTELKSFSCTRPLLEGIIRQHVERLRNVKRLSPYRVEALTGSQTSITGVECRHKKDNSNVQLIQADWVIDASGRSTNAAKWLADLNIQTPALETVDAQLGYATQRYRIPDGWSAPWKVLLVSHQPPDSTQLGYLAQVEGNEFIATLGGYSQQYPPLKHEDFLQAAKQLPTAEFYEAIAQSVPTSDIKAYRATANKLHHYETLPHMPTGFIAIGDSVCALCPAYGQGLSTSAMSAITLRNWLTEEHKPLDARSFQKQLAKRIQPSWNIAAKSDSGFNEAKGRLKTAPLDRVLSKYMQRMMRKSQGDRELALKLAKVSHMIDSPVGLLSPKILLKTI